MYVKPMRHYNNIDDKNANNLKFNLFSLLTMKNIIRFINC